MKFYPYKKSYLNRYSKQDAENSLHQTHIDGHKKMCRRISTVPSICLKQMKGFRDPVSSAGQAGTDHY